MRIIFFLLLSIGAIAQDIVIRPVDWNISPTKYGVVPGSRLILSGDRKEIEFHDLVGTAEKPILITALSRTNIGAVNPGGRVVTFYNCQYVHITGDPDHTGVVNIIINGGGQAVDFRDRSTHVEADHLDITTGYSGINAKTDPTCDPKTWRGNFTLDGVNFHHNRITTKAGEGIYIGESHYHSTFPLSCGTVKSAQEHEVKNVIVEYNVIVTSGADGIQVGSVPSGTCRILYNEVYKFGTAKVFGQNAGVILNPGTVAEVAWNRIDTGTGFGIQLQGPGGSYVHNNFVSNTGTVDGGGIMQVNYMPNGKMDRIVNNTILNVGRVGLEYYNAVDFSGNVLNTKAGVPLYKQGGGLGKVTKAVANIELSGNFEQLKLDAAGVPTETSKIPAGVGYADYKKPEPKVVKEPGTVELIVTDGIKEEWFLVSPSGKRKKI